MFIIDFFKVIFTMLGILCTVIGIIVLLSAFLGNMEIVYKAKILGSEISRMTKVLDRIAWGINGLMVVFKILMDRDRLFRVVMLMEAKLGAQGSLDAPPDYIYRPTTTGYAPTQGTILMFHANSEEEGEPLYVLRPYQFLADDWKAAMGGGV